MPWIAHRAWGSALLQLADFYRILITLAVTLSVIMEEGNNEIPI